MTTKLVDDNGANAPEVSSSAPGSTAFVGYRFIAPLKGWGDMEWEVETPVAIARDGSGRAYVWASVVRRVPRPCRGPRFKRPAPTEKDGLFFLPLPHQSNTQAETTRQ